MRAMSDEALSALTGSRSGERVIAHVWYDGAVVAADLPLSSWSVSSDMSRQVQTQVSLEVRDPDGSLAPWALDDPLGVGGSRIQLIYAMSPTEVVNLGWYRLTKSEPVENWQLYRLGEAEDDVVWVSGGATIPVQADDLTRMVIMDRLLTASSPGASATVLSEVRRLLKDVLPVAVAAGVTDASVSPSVVYERERMDAVEDLLATIGCTFRMTGDGQLEVYPTAPAEPVWTVQGGEDGVLVSVQHSQQIEGLYNAAVVEGATEGTNLPLFAVRTEQSGPLRWDGPHGHAPFFHSATGLLKTQPAVDLAAVTVLADRVRTRSITLNVTCLPHPGLQPGDWVRVASPTVSGKAYPLDGVVRSMELRGSTSGTAPMTLSVECSFEDVQAVVTMIRRARQ